MNDDLKILMELLNEDSNAAQTLSQGIGQQGARTPSRPSQSMNTLGQPQEVEITDEMKANNPVINKAREGGSRVAGASNFLANPEVQNALISFGQAFANTGNYSGQDNPINQIGNAGKDIIKSNANQRAMEAFERGEDVAEAAGRFADPELVTGLQEKQQQQEQFEEELDIAQKSLNIDKQELESNNVYRTAKLTMDKELAEREMANLEKQTEIDEQRQEAQQAYWEAIANQGQGDNQNLALRTNEYLQVLQEQEYVLDDAIANTKDALDNLEVTITDQQLRQLKNGTLEVSDIDISDADNSSWPLNSGNGKEVAENLLSELGTQVKRAQTQRAQLNALKSSQTQRLTGKTEGDIERDRQEMLPGSSSNPIPVSSPAQMKRQEVGTYVDYGGVIYEIGPNNTKRRVSQ